MKLTRTNRALVFPRAGKFIILAISIAVVIVGFKVFSLYRSIFEPNVTRSGMLFIPAQAEIEQVLDSLEAGNFIHKKNSFTWVAKKKSYTNSIKPGAYYLEEGWNNNQLIDKLRSGAQTPIKVTFNNIRFRNELAGKLAQYLMADSATFAKILNDSTIATNYGFTFETFPSMFIPNTYELYWTTSPEAFVQRMLKEHQRFWNESRKAKAAKAGFTPAQIATIASIVQEETIKNDEKKRVAGVYINRLKRGWLLQADPTVKFAVGDFSIKRILHKHLEINSSYNTYKFVGLPPGPINFPDISTIDAVLNYEQHKYLYFCAREDFSGYHNFARTLSQHNRNAARYQRELNKRRIWK